MDALISLRPSAVVGACFALWLLYQLLVYPFLLSPLRRIPRAHWTVGFPYIGSLWILYQRYRSRNNEITAKAHARHGPVVRMGYNEVSVNCYEGGIKQIYGGGFEKHEWYPRQFANFGVMNMFSTVKHTQHAQKKRIMANIYSKSYIQGSAQVQANSHHLLTERFLPLMERLAVSNADVEIHEINNAFTMDFMTAYQFGLKNSTNFTQNETVRKKYLELYHSRREWQWFSAEVPPLIRQCLQGLGISLYPDWIHKANEWLENWSKDMCDAADTYLTTMRSNPPTELSAGDEPLVFKQYKTGLVTLRQKDPVAGFEIHPHLTEGMNFSRGLKGSDDMIPDGHTTLLEVYSDMVDQLAAGHETSALALTYLYYELSRRPEMQDRLHKELNSLKPRLSWPGSEEFVLPAAKDIDALPFLQAIIQETLRLHAPIPGIQPRITPTQPGGVSLGPPGTGYHFTGLPGGVRVSAMAYTLHKISEVFPNPEDFIPQRWLPENTSEAQLLEMNRHHWAFGSGGRMCIGRHLAIQEIKLIVAALYTNYKTHIVDATGIEEADAYTTRPISGKLTIKFEKRRD